MSLRARGNKYVQEIEGKEIHVRRFHRFGCCDCGLVHDVYVEVRRGRVYVRMYLNTRATAAIRRKKRST